MPQGDSISVIVTPQVSDPGMAPQAHKDYKARYVKLLEEIVNNIPINKESPNYEEMKYDYAKESCKKIKEYYANMANEMQKSPEWSEMLKDRQWAQMIKLPKVFGCNRAVFNPLSRLFHSDKNNGEEKYTEIFQELQQLPLKCFNIDYVNNQAKQENDWQFYYEFKTGWMGIPSNIYSSFIHNASILDRFYFVNQKNNVEPSFWQNHKAMLTTVVSFLCTLNNYYWQAQQKKEYYQTQKDHYAQLDIQNQVLQDLSREQESQLLRNKYSYLNERQKTLGPILKQLAQVAPIEAKKNISAMLEETTDKRLKEIIEKKKLDCTVEEFKSFVQDLSLTGDDRLPLAIAITKDGITDYNKSQIIELCKQDIDAQKQDTQTETLTPDTSNPVLPDSYNPHQQDTNILGNNDMTHSLDTAPAA